MACDLITDGAYAYSLWSGQLKIYEGSIYRSPSGASHISKHKNLNCSREPEIVYNSVVWLSEQDDEKAKHILIEYEELSIEKLQEKIDNHRHKIKILKGELI